MPSIRYVNQSAPFWDFVASVEEQGSSHPLFSGFAQPSRRENGEESTENDMPGSFPFGWARQFGPFHGPHHHGGPPPPPAPPEHEGPTTPPGYEQHGPHPPEDGPPPRQHSPHPPHSPGRRPHSPPPPPHHDHHRGPPHRGPRSRCGPPRHGHGPWGGRRGGWDRPGWGGPGAPFNMGALAEFFQSQLFGNQGTSSRTDDVGDNPTASNGKDDFFTPPVDVFDTETAYHVHVSLPGAKKEDIGVQWDAEKSELTIAGVVYRPGDEDFLKTLALDERKVGPFERKVRLGSRANPAKVDEDGIRAKMEDGILRIEVPKEDKDYVEIKKVDIE